MKHIYPTIPCLILLGSARKPCFSKSYILEEAASENEQMSVTYYKNIWGWELKRKRGKEAFFEAINSKK